jgi:acetate kinase
MRRARDDLVVLVLNAGSSTFKWTLLNGGDRKLLKTGNEAWQGTELERHVEQIHAVLHGLSGFDAVGHRVVHGGARFRAATLIDPAVRADLEALVTLDPLHMRPALAAIDGVSAEFPEVSQVAAFDTSFHARLPEAAAGYPLPFEWTERWGLRRYGFHGLSLEYSVAQTQRLLDRLPARLIICHLGSGCSITAVADGKSIDTTMGFSPLEGVMMATRSGSVDPGLLLHLQLHCGVSVEELGDVLANRSGLLGVSGVSGDLRRLLAVEQTAPRAKIAYEQFIWSLRRAVGQMAGVLGGVDGLVFTGGIGENNARVRAEVAATLAFAGLRLQGDDAASVADRIISAPESTVKVLVIHAREDLVILAEVLRHTAGR